MNALDLHVTLAVVTIASMAIGALVELLYRPARQRDVDALREEVRSRLDAHVANMQGSVDGFFNEAREIREEMRVRLTAIETRLNMPPPSGSPPES